MFQATHKIRTRLLIGVVPAIMLMVFARQIYLQHSAQLSTWKGGGMGMFAAADGSVNRYAKVFIISPQKGRQPLLRLTPPQQRMLSRALWYPVRSSFASVANVIFATNWASSDLPSAVSHVNSYGKQIVRDPQFYYMNYPYGRRTDGGKPDWMLEFEYWVMSYDPATRRIRARLVQTHRFGVQD
jgi:hypothetical protein